MKISAICSALLLLIVFACNTRNVNTRAKAFLTTADKSFLFKERPELLKASADTGLIISIDTAQRYQEMDGFGFALTGGSAMLIHQLPDSVQDTLLHELFSRDGIGISYIRVSIGASDLDDHVFSYNDLPAGKTDPALTAFTLQEDHKHLIPVLKKIKTIQPSISIMASPWSPPVWMKDNGKAKGGKLLPQYYDSYANYFVKYIRAMEAEGVRIHAITLQNEPENPHNTPSLLMTADDQRVFVAAHLGPLFEKENIDTKIIVFDHNGDHPDYPIAILNDSVARRYIDGSAFHLYLGDITALSTVHDAHPDKNIYFTEQWTSGNGEFGGDLHWHTKNLIIGAPRNWSRTVIEWNLANDPGFGPHTDDGGCTLCQGALTIGDSITRNVSYYIIAHASREVVPGSVRVKSSSRPNVGHVAYRRPDGQVVVILQNENSREQICLLKIGSSQLPVTMPPGSVATIVWDVTGTAPGSPKSE